MRVIPYYEEYVNMVNIIVPVPNMLDRLDINIASPSDRKIMLDNIAINAYEIVTKRYPNNPALAWRTAIVELVPCRMIDHYSHLSIVLDRMRDALLDYNIDSDTDYIIEHKEICTNTYGYANLLILRKK